MSNKNLLIKILIGFSFVICMFSAVATIFTLFNILGAMSGNGIGDWSTFFLWFTFIGWIVFGLTNLNNEVHEFWKSL